MQNQHRSAARDVSKRSGTTGGTSGGDLNKSAAGLLLGPGGAPLVPQGVLMQGGINLANHNQSAASSVYTGQIVPGGRLGGAKSSSVHSQKQISLAKIDALRASQ
jgi:hypothetical protein